MSRVIRLQDLLRKIGNCEEVYLNGKDVDYIPKEELGNPLVHIDFIEILASFDSQYDDIPGTDIYAYYVTIL